MKSNTLKIYQGKSGLSETNIQSAILRALEAQTGGRVLRFRNNPIVRVINGREVPIRQCNRFSPKGVPDIIYLANGTSYWIEVKRETEYKWLMKNYERLKTGIAKTKRDAHVQHQIMFIEDIKKRTGNHGFFTYSTPDCMEKLGIKLPFIGQ